MRYKTRVPFEIKTVNSRNKHLEGFKLNQNKELCSQLAREAVALKVMFDLSAKTNLFRISIAKWLLNSPEAVLR